MTKNEFEKKYGRANEVIERIEMIHDGKKHYENIVIESDGKKGVKELNEMEDRLKELYWELQFVFTGKI